MLATQCAVVGSLTRSPSTSPVIHLRRRKTLQMLLTGDGDGSRRSGTIPSSKVNFKIVGTLTSARINSILQFLLSLDYVLISHWGE
ncbi:hypothetical protein L1987_49963 [Smallanthus sonchifolius]|uniref:Uncharacterized protein n=1 Tax=Smallanthus sonchifolius TaxID=185202 RepID=A0ACB9FX22_9ASTR|nr:hypothetical protein L1987_49963 [Smallanthus sonchifolius]